MSPPIQNPKPRQARSVAPLAVWGQYLIPKRLITALFGCLANARLGIVTTWMIRHFIRRYDVNMAEAIHSDPKSYTSFNAFFTRALNPKTRLLASAALVCPVDGVISQFGRLQQDQLLQAKDHTYRCADLLGEDTQDATLFGNGHYACLYLSPQDYHRVHMPCAGTLRRMVYIPGNLFSVQPLTVRYIPGLFARNERVVCWFDTDFGPLVLVLVGATIVGSIATVWHGVVTPSRRGHMQDWHYPGANALRLSQGQAMGHFQLGSTVLWLLPQQSLHPVAFATAWQTGGRVRVGAAMLEQVAAPQTDTST